MEPQATWSAEPERVDPEDYAAGSPFVRQMTWAPCAACEIQVHAMVAQILFRGLCCPRCEDMLLPASDEPEEWLQRILREEDEMAEQL